MADSVHTLNVCARIPKFFNKAQISHTLHSELALELRKCFQEASYTDFLNALLDCIKHALLIDKLNVCVEHTFKFVSGFLNLIERNCESTDNVSNLRNDILQFIITVSDSDNEVIRYRSCQLLHVLLEDMKNEANNIDDATFKAILDCMFDRQCDISKRVQIYANYALARLQRVEDPEDPVIKSYMQHLKCNPNASARLAILKCLPITSLTIPHLIDRARDCSTAVRSSVYSILAERVHIDLISVQHCLYLMESVLYDPCEEIRGMFFSKLFSSWINTFNGELSALLTHLNASVSSEIFKQILYKYFEKYNGLDSCVKNFLKYEESAFDLERKIVVSNKITVGRAFMWLTLCEFVRDKAETLEKERLLDLILPSTSELCSYLKNDLLIGFQKDMFSFDKTNEVFIFGCVLKLLLVTDLSDSYGRTELIDLVGYLVLTANIPVTLFEGIAQIMFVLQRKQNKLTEWAMELISELHEPLVKVGSGEISNVIADDAAVMYRCLCFGREVIKVLTSDIYFPPLQHFYGTFVVPSLLSIDVQTRCAAFSCLSMICSMNKDLATQNMMLFFNAIKRDNDEVSNIALKGIFDIILAHDICVSESSPETCSNIDLVRMLTSFLRDENEVLRTTAVVGFCKLFCLGKCCCPALFSKLTLLSFNPYLAPGNSELKKSLNNFFPFFSLQSDDNKVCIGNSLIYSVKTLLFRSGANDSLNEISLTDVVKLLTRLCAITTNTTHENNNARESSSCDFSFHGSMALQLLQAFASDKKYHCHVSKLLKMLNYFDLRSCSNAQVKELYSVNKQLSGRVSKKHVSGLKAFGAKLMDILQERTSDETIVADSDSENSAGDRTVIATNSTVNGNRVALLSKSTMLFPDNELPDSIAMPTSRHTESSDVSSAHTETLSSGKSDEHSKTQNNKQNFFAADKSISLNCYVRLKRLSCSFLCKETTRRSAPPFTRVKTRNMILRNSFNFESLSKTASIYESDDSDFRSPVSVSKKRENVKRGLSSMFASRKKPKSTISPRYSLRLRSNQSKTISRGKRFSTQTKKISDVKTTDKTSSPPSAKRSIKMSSRRGKKRCSSRLVTQSNNKRKFSLNADCKRSMPYRTCKNIRTSTNTLKSRQHNK